jgi:hypothetical protein
MKRSRACVRAEINAPALLRDTRGDGPSQPRAARKRVLLGGVGKSHVVIPAFCHASHRWSALSTLYFLYSRPIPPGLLAR